MHRRSVSSDNVSSQRVITGLRSLHCCAAMSRQSQGQSYTQAAAIRQFCVPSIGGIDHYNNSTYIRQYYIVYYIYIYMHVSPLHADQTIINPMKKPIALRWSSHYMPMKYLSQN